MQSGKVIPIKIEIPSTFLLSYRSMGGSFGEREMLWEHESIGERFRVFFELSETFTSVSIAR